MHFAINQRLNPKLTLGQDKQGFFLQSQEINHLYLKNGGPSQMFTRRLSENALFPHIFVKLEKIILGGKRRLRY
jgi:hypothetical protein